ncbi:YjiH family protein [Planococcus sp. CP5-4]|uniref:YjiH family protein n=1 Tax=unclassified Planococcus (in: firmicutes) TaxID=2662419 RepID=UPI001C21479B|nr:MULTISPECIES: YjiH family protein [unclassified Planococcus (in: firmicutes)]MBU9673525.1 YjiH family protein [Planococcus sp. CP5-4_YE]MBV0908297.1 YjiH family protein [Planococcus sp. CP5-4_UN]MBW6062359.1 YjiH family protein [Planococcus sp. CP5-4]
MKKFSASTWLLFLIPSFLGILLFLVPVPTTNADGDTEWMVTIAVLANWMAGEITSIVPWILLILLTIAAVGSLLYITKKPVTDGNVAFFNKLFNVNLFWTITRLVAAIFAFMVLFQVGPEAIWSDATGGLLLDGEDGLLSFLFTIFLFAGLLLPLLMNFGLLEFFGTMMSKIMRPLFRLPGRSSIDALASWVGDGTIGVLLTNKQYEENKYTQREAAIIGTTFSVVSITFAIVVIGEIGLANYFLPYYGTVILTGVLLALIMPRIYPLTNKPTTFIDGSAQDSQTEDVPKGYNVASHGIEKALEKADRNRSVVTFFKDGFKNVLDMWIGVAPVVMAFGTIALILAEYTSTFTILGTPFEPYLNLLGIPEAAEAAQLMVIGFADMFLPAILGAGIESEMTRFVVATMSVTQLIYMSEVGGLLLGSKIPVNIVDLIIIFLLRTIIALPIIAGVAHLLF